MVSTLFPLAPIVPTVSTLIAFRIPSIVRFEALLVYLSLVELKLFYDLAQQRSAHYLLLDHRQSFLDARPSNAFDIVVRNFLIFDEN